MKQALVPALLQIQPMMSIFETLVRLFDGGR
jgi:hypothetical protein